MECGPSRPCLSPRHAMQCRQRLELFVGKVIAAYFDGECEIYCVADGERVWVGDCFGASTLRISWRANPRRAERRPSVRHRTGDAGPSLLVLDYGPTVGSAHP